MLSISKCKDKVSNISYLKTFLAMKLHNRHHTNHDDDGIAMLMIRVVMVVIRLVLRIVVRVIVMVVMRLVARCW